MGYCVMKCFDLQQVRQRFVIAFNSTVFETWRSHMNWFPYFATFMIDNWVKLKHHLFLNVHSIRVQINATKWNEIKRMKTNVQRLFDQQHGNVLTSRSRISDKSKYASTHTTSNGGKRVTHTDTQIPQAQSNSIFITLSKTQSYTILPMKIRKIIPKINLRKNALGTWFFSVYFVAMHIVYECGKYITNWILCSSTNNENTKMVNTCIDQENMRLYIYIIFPERTTNKRAGRKWKKKIAEKWFSPPALLMLFFYYYYVKSDTVASLEHRSD